MQQKFRPILRESKPFFPSTLEFYGCRDLSFQAKCAEERKLLLLVWEKGNNSNKRKEKLRKVERIDKTNNAVFY